MGMDGSVHFMASSYSLISSSSSNSSMIDWKSLIGNKQLNFTPFKSMINYGLMVYIIILLD